MHDRVTFRPRLPIPGLAALLERVVDAFFRHRHRRLQEISRQVTIEGVATHAKRQKRTCAVGI